MGQIYILFFIFFNASNNSLIFLDQNIFFSLIKALSTDKSCLPAKKEKEGTPKQAASLAKVPAPVILLIMSIGLKVLEGKKYCMHSNKMAEPPTIHRYFNTGF